MKKYLGALAALGALLAASAAWSHHGSAPHFFMDRNVEFAGTVRSFEARNPHSFVNVEVTEGGETVLWRCELNSIASIRRAGIDENSFAVGSQVRLTGHPGRHDEHECYFRSATFADGRTVTQGQVPPRRCRRLRRQPLSSAAFLAPGRAASSPQGVWGRRPCCSFCHRLAVRRAPPTTRTVTTPRADAAR